RKELMSTRQSAPAPLERFIESKRSCDGRGFFVDGRAGGAQDGRRLLRRLRRPRRPPGGADYCTASGRGCGQDFVQGTVVGGVVTNWNEGPFTGRRTQVRMRRNARFKADPLSME